MKLIAIFTQGLKKIAHHDPYIIKFHIRRKNQNFLWEKYIYCKIIIYRLIMYRNNYILELIIYTMIAFATIQYAKINSVYLLAQSSGKLIYRFVRM